MNSRRPDRENSRAVLIGVGSYDHHERLHHIPAAANNLADLHQLLTTPGGTLRSENCWIVADPSNSAHIGHILEDAAEQASDTLLVYYTGHGVLDRRGRLHLALTGTHPDRTRWTALPFSTLREAVLDSPATTRILILDCCFSGRAFEALTDGPDAILGQADIAGTYTITSSARNEPSFAPIGDRHTAFTAALLAAATGTPGLPLDDLYTHTQRHLQRHGHPEPQRRTTNAAGQIILFPNPNPAPQTIEELENALTNQRETLGDDHPDTLLTGHNLAHAYEKAGRVEDAIGLYEEVMAARRRLGEDAPATLTTGHNLATAYRKAGRDEDAIGLYEQVLVVRRGVLGEDDPATLATGHNLAFSYEKAGRVKEAIGLYEQVLAARRRVLGEDDPATLATGRNLAHAYQKTGRVEEAIELYEPITAGARRVLGEDDPDTWVAVHNLALAYELVGRVEEAIGLYEEVLAARRRVLGEDAPPTLATGHNLATAYRKAGRVEDAIGQYEQVLAIRRRVLGEDDPATLDTEHNLAYTYQNAGRVEDSIGLYEQVLAARRRVLGEDAPPTLATGHNLASVYRKAGRVEEAIGLYEQVLAARRRVLGEDAPPRPWPLGTTSPTPMS
ncbi:caspase, EACC1-associated type [Nocardia grenadensis]|uniref:caspase, EACC1-associated type n=1 Tax=Nocardia grenadensis TaxID=931537 RepID=UPI0007A3A234|nr:tetratricopeptide repeat protein [Nocardia grenadensis]